MDFSWKYYGYCLWYGLFFILLLAFYGDGRDTNTVQTLTLAGIVIILAKLSVLADNQKQGTIDILDAVEGKPPEEEEDDPYR